jgi:hypothetical protein
MCQGKATGAAALFLLLLLFRHLHGLVAFFHVLHLGAAATDESRRLVVNLLLLNLQEKKDEHFCCRHNSSSSCWNGKPQHQHQRQ